MESQLTEKITTYCQKQGATVKEESGVIVISPKEGDASKTFQERINHQSWATQVKVTTCGKQLKVTFNDNATSKPMMPKAESTDYQKKMLEEFSIEDKGTKQSEKNHSSKQSGMFYDCFEKGQEWDSKMSAILTLQDLSKKDSNTSSDMQVLYNIVCLLLLATSCIKLNRSGNLDTEKRAIAGCLAELATFPLIEGLIAIQMKPFLEGHDCGIVDMLESLMRCMKNRYPNLKQPG